MFNVCSHLRFLNLNNTGLATWDEVDRIAQFPALRSLRVQVCFVLYLSNKISKSSKSLLFVVVSLGTRAKPLLSYHLPDTGIASTVFQFTELTKIFVYSSVYVALKFA